VAERARGLGGGQGVLGTSCWLAQAPRSTCAHQDRGRAVPSGSPRFSSPVFIPAPWLTWKGPWYLAGEDGRRGRGEWLPSRSNAWVLGDGCQPQGTRLALVPAGSRLSSGLHQAQQTHGQVPDPAPGLPGVPPSSSAPLLWFSPGRSHLHPKTGAGTQLCSP